MLRGILAAVVLVPLTAALALPVMIIVPLVPRWADLAMHMARAWSRVMLWITGARVTYHGRERLGVDESCIFIANHQSNADIWALAQVLPLNARFAAKAELFRVPVLGPAMAASGFVPIDRGSRSDAIRSLQLAAERVRSGRSVVLFPEGTRSRNGRLQPFKKGAFHLALQAGVPVVPVAISGTHALMPPGSLRVTPGPVDVYFEPPVDTSTFQPDRYDELRATVHETLAKRLGRRPVEAPPRDPSAEAP